MLGVISCIFLKKKPHTHTKKPQPTTQNKERPGRRIRSRKSNSKGMFEVFPSDYVCLPFCLFSESTPYDQPNLCPKSRSSSRQISAMTRDWCHDRNIIIETETSLYKQVPALLLTVLSVSLNCGITCSQKSCEFQN